VWRAGDGWDTEAPFSRHPLAPGVCAEFQEHSGTPKGFISLWCVALRYPTVVGFTRARTIAVYVSRFPGDCGEYGFSNHLAVPGVCDAGACCRYRQWPAGLRYVLHLLPRCRRPAGPCQSDCSGSRGDACGFFGSLIQQSRARGGLANGHISSRSWTRAHIRPAR
jgi:hypothetical protein